MRQQKQMVTKIQEVRIDVLYSAIASFSRTSATFPALDCEAAGNHVFYFLF